MKDNIQVKVPQDSSVVSIWSQNGLRDGDEVTETEILHADGTRSPRYVQSLGGLRMKAAALKDLKALEARVYPLLVKLTAELTDLTQKLWGLSDKTVRGTYKGIWYEFIPGRGPSRIIWSQKTPRARNKSLVPHLVAMMERNSTVSKRRSFIAILLHNEILRESHRVFGWSRSSPVRILINQRTYLLVPSGSKLGGFYVAGVVGDLPQHEV